MNMHFCRNAINGGTQAWPVQSGSHLWSASTNWHERIKEMDAQIFGQILTWIARPERSFEKIGRQGSRMVLAGATWESIRHCQALLRWGSHVKILLYQWIDYDINVIQGTPVWELCFCKRDNQLPLLPEHWPIQKQNQKSIISHNVVY